MQCLGFARSDAAESHSRREHAAQREVRIGRERFIAIDAERPRDVAEYRREVTVDAGDFGDAEAAMRDVEQRAALVLARACGHVTPERRAREPDDLDEASRFVMDGTDHRQRATCRLLDVFATKPLEARELAALHVRLEPGGVREASRRERRVGELEHDPRRHQNSEYSCVRGRVLAGSQVSVTPSARTS